MKSKFSAETQQLENEIGQLRSTVNGRDEELLSEKLRYASLQKDHEKLKNKLNETNKYLAELATKEETRQLKDELQDARDEIERQKDELKSSESKLTKAKLTVREKVKNNIYTYIFSNNENSFLSSIKQNTKESRDKRC